MRILFLIVLATAAITGAAAQNSKPADPSTALPESSTRTFLPGYQQHIEQQPQGPTGPLDTRTTGGAPAESPQGQSAPGMQAAPEGSSKLITDEK